MFVSMNPRQQGDIGELSAMYWLASIGAPVALPVGHSPDWDLIAELHGRLIRVQVKTSTLFRDGRWRVSIKTCGGNQSWNGVVKKLDPSRCDYLFVLVGDGRRWFIPSKSLGGGSHIRIGGPKYAQYEVAPGDPIADRTASSSGSRIGSPVSRGDARVAKGIAL
jgi:hypothetical protein